MKKEKDKALSYKDRSKAELLRQILSEHADMRKRVTSLRQAEALRRFENDLKAIRRIDPKIKSAEDLDREFFELVKNGIDGVTAFLALREKKKSGRRSAPPGIGRVSKDASSGKDYFTAKELDLLSGRQLDDPRVLKKALRSMVKRKK